MGYRMTAVLLAAMTALLTGAGYSLAMDFRFRNASLS